MKSYPKYLLVFVLCFCPIVAAEDPTRPNIIVFLVDDMGVMDTSVPFLTDAQGTPKRYPLNDLYRTPNMERLAASGIRFNNFYAMSVCSPTRISIMTGQNAARHHTTQWIAPENNNRGKFGPPDWNWTGLKSGDFTLPGWLRTHGYQTIHVGKAHFGPFDHEGDNPANLGFDVNIAGRAIGAPGSYFAKDHYARPLNKNGKRPGRDRSVPHLEKYHDTDTHLSEALTLEAIEQVQDCVSNDKPFFLYLAHYAVHSPHQSDPRFADNYASASVPERGKAFATLIEGMDDSLGKVIDEIDRLGIGKETLVFFLGDNGSDAPLGHEHEVACAAPLRGKKGSHYEGGVRVPFIASWVENAENHPLQSRLPVMVGENESSVASVCDLLPTIADLVGSSLPSDHTIDGSSLGPLLAGQEDDERKQSFLMHFPHEHRSNYYSTLRVGDFKIAYHYFPGEDSEGKRHQLFNLASDPFEQNDLSESDPKKLAEMVALLRRELDAHGALPPVTDAGPLKPDLN